MGNSVLVFVSHSSEDKESLIEPLVKDLESCYINVWLDKKKILPGDNLRQSIFRDGLDKADVALIFFTENSLQSSWVDREIKHVLREEKSKGNNFNLNKIISIFDSNATYKVISERYPELTDDLLHLMPKEYSKIELGQLISAIWSKYLSLQGGDVATQRQILEKDREIFQKEQTIQQLQQKLEEYKSSQYYGGYQVGDFEKMLASGKINEFISARDTLLTEPYREFSNFPQASAARSFGLIAPDQKNPEIIELTDEGREFFKWYLLKEVKS